MSNDAPITPAYTMHPKMRRRLRSYRIRSAARRWLRGFVRGFRMSTCRHEFRLGDQSLTNIPIPPEPPRGASWKDCQKWADEVVCGNHPSHTQRVQWPCAKCGKIFYEHCGLDVLAKHGRISPNDKAQPRAGE